MSDDKRIEHAIARIELNHFLDEHGARIEAARPAWAVQKRDHTVAGPDHEGTYELEFHSEQLLEPGPNDAIVHSRVWFNEDTRTMLVEQPTLSVGLGKNDVINFATASDARRAAKALRKAADAYDSLMS